MAYRTQILPPGEVDDRYYLGSVGRAVSLLDYLARVQRPQKLADLVAGLGWNKPMVYRLVRTLETHGAVRAHRDGYVLGPLVIALGQGALAAIQLPELARPHLERLHNEFNETINLSILDGDEIVILQRVETREILGLRLSVGSRLPAYCTSVGHVLLADLEDTEVERRLAHTEFDTVGPNTITSTAKLIERLHQVQIQGYAVNDEELAKGHRAAAAPIRDHSERVVAAINVSLPAARINERDVRSRIVPELVATATALSTQLGSRAF
jgi:IclR family pca regulon transcriptional regulator